MAKRNVDIKIQARDKASRAFRNAGKGVTRFGKTMRGVGKSLMSVQGLLGGIGLAMAGKKMITAWSTQQSAVKGLSDALASLGVDAAAAMPGMERFAAGIQKMTTLGDEAVMELMKLGATLGRLEGDALQGATKAAIGLAKRMGVDTVMAMRLVARAAVGDTATLSRYGIKLDQTMTKQEKFNELLRMGAESFKLAVGEAETAKGQYEKFTNVVGDSFEIMGERIVGAFTKADEGQKTFLQDLTASIDAMNEFKKMEMEGERRRKRIGLEKPEKGWLAKTHDVAAAPGRWFHEKVVGGLAEALVDVAGETEKGNLEAVKLAESMKALREEFKKGAISQIEYSKQLGELSKLHGILPYKHPKGQSPQELAEKNKWGEERYSAFLRWQESQYKEKGAFPGSTFEQWKKREPTPLPQIGTGLEQIGKSIKDSLLDMFEQVKEQGRRSLIRAHFGKDLADAERELIRQRAAAGNKEAQFKLEQLRIEEELAASRRKMQKIIADEVATEQQKLRAKQKLSELEQVEAARVESVRKNMFDTDLPTGPKSLAAVESRFLTRAPGHYDPFKDMRKDNRRIIKATEETAKATKATAAKPTEEGVNLAVVKF